MPHHDRKIGIILPQWEGSMGGETARGKDLITQAKLIEELGFDSVWTVDAILYDLGDYQDVVNSSSTDDHSGSSLGFWECWSVVSALSAATSRVEIGTLVTCAAYRHPALLARMADTVDELSAGRLILGVGAGAMRSEFETFGFDWERRVSRFEEALNVICPLLRGDTVSFDGEFYRIQEARLVPKGCRSAGPPVLIGTLGKGPRMRRLVAQYAQQWNCWLAEDSRLDAYNEAWELVRGACNQYGRDPATLTRNVAVGVCLEGDPAPGELPLMGSTAQIAEQLDQFFEAGVDHLVVELTSTTATAIEQFSEVLSYLE
jgi:probable F420-dependent oxidoreductase